MTVISAFVGYFNEVNVLCTDAWEIDQVDKMATAFVKTILTI